MPRTTETKWDPANNKYVTREVGVDEDADTNERVQNASGLGSKVKAVRPLRKSAESASDYADRVAAWQKRQDEAQVAGQKTALRKIQ